MRAKTLGLFALGLAWMACALAWLAGRGLLAGLFQQPWNGPGLWLLLGGLAVSAWAVVEEPSLGPQGGRGLLPWSAGALALVLGQAWLYPNAGGKDALAPLGFALLLGGAGLLQAPGPWRRRALWTALALALLGLSTMARRSTMPWDLFQGPWLGQHSLSLFWLLLAWAVFVLAKAGAGPQAGSYGLPLSRKQEAALLALVLLLGAALRFWRPGELPQGWWYDEVNLARAVSDRVLATGKAPLYVAEQVENPGALLWVSAVFFKLFGPGVQPLRLASGLFGLLAVIPLWALARLWVGPRWALLAALLYACSRWTLIPQRIGFMSGFALFWMLAAFWAVWSAHLRPGALPGRSRPAGGLGRWAGEGRWLLAGLLLGANLHTYTPARFVPLIAFGFLGLQALLDRSWRLRAADTAALLLGFLITAAPMLWYIQHHWAEYSMRSAQVSIFKDVALSGRPLHTELWGTFSKHLLMFNYRGDFNARHNLHFLPHLDLLTACLLVLALPGVLAAAWRDARCRFVLLWLGFMLAAGIFTMPVEAPQGHRTILAAPALFLALGLALPPYLQRFKAAWGGRWPQTLRALGAWLLFGIVALNAHELFVQWPGHQATFRSFSPRGSAVARRIQATGPGTVVATSALPQEYQFNGYEWGAFARFVLAQQQRPWLNLRPGLQIPAEEGGQGTRSALLIWGESDADISELFARAYPDLPVERVPQPFPGAGEPNFLYLAAEIPWERIPLQPPSDGRPVLVTRAP